MSKGKIKVTADNIFPIIKKFLYSDHEIFLRELVSNAVDATNKLQKLASIGEYKGEVGDTTIEVEVDKKAGTLSVHDRGIGMTAEEVKKYINDIALSGAEEFLKKYKDKTDTADIIGHFGLGFYSSFMVAKKVEIFTKSHNQEGEEKGVYWSCEGEPEYELKTTPREDRGTTVVLHLNDDSREFLEKERVEELLAKYCKFLPVPIKFGTREEKITRGEGEDAKEEKQVVDNIINNTHPAWTKQPAELKDEDYKNFYRELYPHSFEEPLFHIHLNVDFPFNLTGILYFPRLKPNMEIQKNKIQLYQNQVFVTDSVEGIVPDFLTMLHGVLDSPDIPLNVSRSYLQSDHNVKKISGHITKKVADKLEELFKKDRKDFEKKWKDIRVIIEYGMLTESKFFDKAKKFALLKNVDDEYFTIDEYREKIRAVQTDKDENTVALYAANKDEQHPYIKRAREKGYDVLIMDSPITSHFVQKLESEYDKLQFKRVDADSLDKLIAKEENRSIKLSEDEKKKVKEIAEQVVEKGKFTVEIEGLDSDENPVIITQPEFSRRMKEMSQTGGGGFGMENMPDMYNLVINGNHELIGKIAGEKENGKQKALLKQAVDLAMLSQNLLQGEKLSDFIKRSYELMDK